MADYPFVDCLKISLACAMWYLFSTFTNILGKMILSDFPYPMTVTFTNLVTASIVLGPVTTAMEVPKGKSLAKSYYYYMVIPLAIGKFVSSISSYFSILKTSVSYAHTGMKAM